MSKFARWDKIKIKRRFILLLVVILLAVGWHGLTILRPWDVNITIPAKRDRADYIFENMVLTSVFGSQISYRVSSNYLTLDRTQGIMDRVTGSVYEQNGVPLLDFNATNGILNVGRQSFVFYNFSGHTFSKQLWQVASGEAHWNSRSQDFTLLKQPRIYNKDTQITAPRMIYRIPQDAVILAEGSEITKDDYVLRSEKITLYNTRGLVAAEEKVSLTGNDMDIRASTLNWDISRDELLFQNNVQMQTEGIVLTGQNVSLNIASETAMLYGDVRFDSPEQKLLVNTDRALWHRETQQIEFLENTRIWKDGSYMEGDKVIYDYGKNDLSSEGGGRTRIIRNDEE